MKSIGTHEGTLWSVTRRINCEVATPMQFGMLKTNPWIIWAIGPLLSHKCPTNVAKFARNSKCATQNLRKSGFTGYFRPKLSALRIKKCCTIFFRSKYDQKREFFRILKFASGYSMPHAHTCAGALFETTATLGPIIWRTAAQLPKRSKLAVAMSMWTIHCSSPDRICASHSE